MKAIHINWKKIMRRTACLICAVCILLSGVQLQGSAREGDAALYEKVELSEGSLSTDMVTNVRKGPGTEHAVVAGMKPGDTCIVLGEEDGWYRVEFGGIEGYVSKDLLTVRTYETEVPMAVETPTPTAMPGYELIEVLIGEVAADVNVNVRAGAGKEHEVLLELAPGDSCTVLDKEEIVADEAAWLHVRYGELEGYVLKDLLQITVQLIQVPLAEGTAAPGYEWVEAQVGTLIAQVKTNVRTGAGTGHEVICEMTPGETCVVLGEENGWYRIEYNGIEGWISKEYVEVSLQMIERPVATATPEPTAEPTEEPTAEPTAEAVPTEVPEAAPGHEWTEAEVGRLITEVKANVRAGAGTEHGIICQMSPGETCVVLGEENGWYRIEYDGTEGWISRDFLEVSLQMIERPAATATPEPTAEPTEEPTEEPTAEPTPEIAPTEVPEAEPGYEWVEAEVGTLIAQAKTNVRAGAGTGYEILGRMAPGETCVVLGEENDWYRIDYDGMIGWIAKEYISTEKEVVQRPLPTATPEPTETPVPAETAMPGHELREALVGTVVADASISFRTGPGTNYAVVDYIAPGRYCIVLDDEMEFYEVMYNGRVGYVAKEYLEVAEKVTQVPLATATPVPTEQPTAEPTAEVTYETKEQQVGTVIAQAVVNVRAGAGTDYEIIGQLAPKDTRAVLGEENGWYLLDMSGRTGYVSKEFIELSMQTMQVPVVTPTPAPTEQPTAMPGYEMVEVVEGTLNAQHETNVRKGPGTDYDVLTQMKPGEICTVLGEENGWYRIEFAGQRGYIAMEYIATRSYLTQVKIIEEDPLDAYVVGFVMPRTMARKDSVEVEGVVEANIPLTGVTFSVYDKRNMVEETAASVEFTHDAGVLAYDLMNMNDDIRFTRLAAGEKRITITVTSANDEQVVYETDFYVLGECDDPVSITPQCSFTSRASRADRVLDGRWSTAWEPSAAGDEMLITVPGDLTSGKLTLEWMSAPSAFEIVLDGETVRYENADGLLSFMIDTSGASQIAVRAIDTAAGVCEARVYAENRVSETVHDWQPASGNVDLMVIAAHQGDEFLFFGGAIPQAVAEGKEVLVVYMADCGRDRLAEAMDGLWAVGVRTHPVCLNMENGRARQYEDAIDMWGLEETYEALVGILRRYKPDVVLTHDIEGEDGDNQHKLTSAALRRAVLLATDEGTYSESSAKYGAWDVKKTYIHRYEGNVMTLDADLPQAALNGWTLREMTTVGFSKNRTLMEDFELEDGEEYSPYAYGVIRTADGLPADELKNSFFENIGETAE